MQATFELAGAVVVAVGAVVYMVGTSAEHVPGFCVVDSSCKWEVDFEPPWLLMVWEQALHRVCR